VLNSINKLLNETKVHSQSSQNIQLINMINALIELTGAVVVVIAWQLDLQLPVQSVSITTKVVSSNPAHGKVYSIQHYVIMFVSDLR